ncbi:Fibronectin type III,Protein kinase, ATP binding site,Tyrosine-protein kinase, active site,Protein kinase [Cinara cedri]|uniref:receptor protein-tyrosine kinase n=1 Tax=Cinara cedri TaxID=506608 RepID=A0A5E4M337_9HEMI|nr:Fibronectin type III,Protein kinase, ATP binding site,Tyrosine-protein kinase, active site,Protein kinase [Cinara cedri]
MARFWSLIDGTARRVIETPVYRTLDLALKREPVNELHILGFHMTNNNILEVELKWQLSSDRNCIYSVRYHPNRLEKPTTLVVDVGQPNYNVTVLTRLTLDMEYTVTVLPKNRPTGSEKTTIKFLTPTCIQMKKNYTLCPPEKPYNVTVTQITKTADDRYKLKITWLSPNPGGQGVDYFTVKLKNEAKNVSATASVTYFEVMLPIHQHYFVSVEAFSELGRSGEVPVLWWPNKNMPIITNDGHLLQWLAILFTVIASCAVALVIGFKYVYWPTKLKATENVDRNDLVLLKDLRENGDLLLDYEDVTVTDVILGNGHFGVVNKGSLRTDDGVECPVAVKSLRDHPTSRDLEEFLSEIVLMQKVGQHPNILSMVGCCLDENKQCMLVVEYCPLGDLQTYLRKVSIKSWYANDFYVDQTDPSELIADDSCDKKVVSLDAGNNSSSRPPMVFNNCYLYHGEENIFLTVDDLMSFASQTANGMSFLEKNRIVHRDLAARNVLLSDHHTIKICDFGLSRDIYEQNCYLKSNRGDPLPVKWMALESLKYRIYTTQSDVWSFGVLLWEIMMLGECPYPMISSSKIYDVLHRGYRMPRPTLCSHSLYQLMIACWHLNPANRPKFSMIKDTIDGILTKQ